MKLITDILRVALMGFVLWFVTVTVLSGGSVAWDWVRKTDQPLKCSVAECEEEVADHKAAAEDAQRALADAERAQLEAIERLERRKQQAQEQLVAIGQRAQVQRAKLDGLVRQNRVVFQELNLADSFEGWAPQDDPERRNQIFIKTCERLSPWSAKRCEGVLREAKVTSQTSTGLAQLSNEDWYQRVSSALDSTCDGLVGFVQDVVRYCSTARDLARGGLVTIHGFLQSADRYAVFHAQAEATQAEAQQEESALARLAGDNRVESALVAARAQQAHTRERLAQAEVSLREAKADPLRVVIAWRDQYWAFIAPFALWAVLLLLVNFLWRPLAYFSFARLIRCAGQMRLLPENRNADAIQSDDREARSYSKLGGPAVPGSAELVARAGDRQVNVRLKPEEHLWVRPEYVTSSRGGGSIWIYGGWRHPFTSYAAGLTGLTHFIGAKRSKITLGGTGEGHGNDYIGCITLKDHPGFALRPRHVVAIRGNLKIRFYWNFELMSLLRGQLRHAVVSGTGAVYVAGVGGVFPQVIGDPGLGREHAQPSDQLKDALIVGWDAQLGVSLRRNENWIHVALLRRDDMFETALLGEGVYVLTHSSRARRSDIAGRLFEGILSAFGKVLGI